MNLQLYTDLHVRRAIAVALRIRGVDVLTTRADGAAERCNSPFNPAQ